MSFNEILLSLDDLCPRSTSDVYGVLCSIPVAERTVELDWELFAFAFRLAGRDNNDVTALKYRPLFSKDSGEPGRSEWPSLSAITEGCVQYWKQRARTTLHPLLRHRYADLVWEFEKKVCKSPASVEFARLSIDSVLEAWDRELIRRLPETADLMSRILDVSVNTKDHLRIDRVSTAILKLDTQLRGPKGESAWGFAFDLLVAPKKSVASAEIEAEIVERLEITLRAQIALGAKANHFAAMNAAERLEHYFNRNTRTEDARRVARDLGVVVQNLADAADALVAIALLKPLMQSFQSRGMKAEAESVGVKLRELGPKAMAGMKTISHFHVATATADEMTQYLSEMVSGTFEEAIVRLTWRFYVADDRIKDQLDRLKTEFPMAFLFPEAILEDDGRIVAEVGNIEDDLDGHLAVQIAREFVFTSPFLRRSFHAFFEKHDPRYQLIFDYLFDAPALRALVRGIVVEGVSAYAKGNYLVAIHLLVPQLERILRTIAVDQGLSAYRIARSGGIHLRLLDDLLREQKVVMVLTEPICRYLRILLTDQRGWNLRNRLAHAQMEEHHFGAEVADRAFHALLLLARLRPLKSASTDEDTR